MKKKKSYQLQIQNQKVMIFRIFMYYIINRVSLNGFISLIKYIQDDIFNKNENIIEIFNNIIWKGENGLNSLLLSFIEVYLHLYICIQNQLTDTLSLDIDINQLKSIVFIIINIFVLFQIVKFNDILFTCLLHPNDNVISEFPKTITNYHVEVYLYILLYFYQKIRKSLLTLARNELINNFENTVLVSNSTERCYLVSPTSKLGKIRNEIKNDEIGGEFYNLNECQVSSSVQIIFDTIHRYLYQLKSLPIEYIEVIYKSVRDMILTYHAIIPTYHKELIENNIRFSLILYNDCNYIIHHLTTLSIQYCEMYLYIYRFIDYLMNIIKVYHLLI